MIETMPKNPESVGLKRHDTSTAGMVFIPAGPFIMGDDVGGEFEKPVHKVSLDAFWMDETPVTNEQYAEFVRQTGYQTEAEKIGAAWGFRDGKFSLIPNLSWQNYALSDRADHPVVLVTWNDAAAYAKWAGKKLPTEAQWEKTARGSLVGALYPWGQQPPDGKQSNFAKSPAEIPSTTQVKSFSPNANGLYDMVGNVWQWCADWYADNYYSVSPSENPGGPNVGICRVRRGGSWNVIQSFRLRAANRGAFEPHKAAPNVGFRCVV